MIELSVLKFLEENPELKMIVNDMILIELNAIGFKSGLVGYTYLTEAIWLYLSQPLESDIISGIYHSLASKYKRTPLSINRSITKSIYETWYSGNLNSCNYTLNTTSVTTAYMPQNAEFIATIAENVIIQMRLKNIV
ncbi:MAG: hypothetical protein IKJ87_04855 [Ruminococcus sp.]|nr:hypothetical protein [Ruminococcus sp.]